MKRFVLITVYSTAITFYSLFGYLLFRRLWTTYVVSRIARAADKSTKK
ncbi:MAG: hypothetical protein ACLUFP_07915 [Streptococcus salivarius]